MAGEPDGDNKPSFLERQRAAHPSFDRLMRAADRYQSQKGDYYAAGLTYFTVLAIVPIIMVGFSLVGFVLAGRPELLTTFATSSLRTSRENSAAQSRT